MNGQHFILMKGYSVDTIFVNDPGFNTDHYSLGEVVNSGVYTRIMWKKNKNKLICDCLHNNCSNELYLLIH